MNGWRAIGGSCRAVLVSDVELSDSLVVAHLFQGPSDNERACRIEFSRRGAESSPSGTVFEGLLPSEESSRASHRFVLSSSARYGTLRRCDADTLCRRLTGSVIELWH